MGDILGDCIGPDLRPHRGLILRIKPDHIEIPLETHPGAQVAQDDAHNGGHSSGHTDRHSDVQLAVSHGAM